MHNWLTAIGISFIIRLSNVYSVFHSIYRYEASAYVAHNIQPDWDHDKHTSQWHDDGYFGTNTANWTLKNTLSNTRKHHQYWMRSQHTIYAYGNWHYCFTGAQSSSLYHKTPDEFMTSIICSFFRSVSFRVFVFCVSFSHFTYGIFIYRFFKQYFPNKLWQDVNYVLRCDRCRSLHTMYRRMNDRLVACIRSALKINWFRCFEGATWPNQCPILCAGSEQVLSALALSLSFD